MNFQLDDRAGFTVILADGECPSHAAALEFFHSASQVVACDGAWRTSVALGRIPDAVVGDGDSIGSDDTGELSRLGVPVYIDPEQDTNDLCKAFRYAKRHFKQGKTVILGATGKREDHAIGNIFHVADFASDDPNVILVTNAGVFEPVLPPGRYWGEDVVENSPISIFATHPDTVMNSKGLKWPLLGVKFDSLWRGTLNRTTGGGFSIETDRPAIIFRPHS